MIRYVSNSFLSQLFLLTAVLLMFSIHVSGQEHKVAVGVDLLSLPSGEVEFGAGGKRTVAVTLGGPWFRDRDTHRYLQITSLQPELRWHRSDSLFKGPFVGVYDGVQRYGVGLDGSRGWQGEAAGGGLSFGWEWLCGRERRLSVSLSAQMGLLATRYDNYVWGDPVTGTVDGHYYYDWKGLAEDFVSRRGRYVWLGPTRVGISVRYVFKRRNG